LFSLDKRFIQILLITGFVFLQHPSYGTVDLFTLLVKIVVGTAPLFGGITGQLATINGKHIFTNQTTVVTHQQHLLEQAGDLLMAGGNEIRNRREVWLTIGGQCHKQDVVSTQGFYLATVNNAFAVSQYDNLE